MNPKLCRIVLAGLLCGLGVSCTTAYDAYGRPQQVVDPGLAIAGVAAAGLVGYGLANSNNHNRPRSYRNYDHYERGHYGHRSYSYGHGSCYRPSYYRSYRGGHGYHH